MKTFSVLGVGGTPNGIKPCKQVGTEVTFERGSAKLINPPDPHLHIMHQSENKVRFNYSVFKATYYL